jgi:hypothetical protein
MKRLLTFIGASLLAGLAHADLATKTIEYSFMQSSASVASAGVRNFDGDAFGTKTLSVYIPENLNRTIRSAFVEVFIMDNPTSAANMTAHAASLQVNSVTFSTTTLTDTTTNSGENMQFKTKWDFTSYFSTNFGSASSSGTVKLNYVATGSGTQNASAKLVITYDYDTSTGTRIKTIHLPINSSTGPLTETLQEIWPGLGLSNQVPQLNNLLPEQGIVIRDIFFNVLATDGLGAALPSDPFLALALDSETEDADLGRADTLVSTQYNERIWKRTDMSTTTAHAFKVRTSSTSCGFPGIGAILTVTYEYDHATSTRIINSIQIPVAQDKTVLGGSTYANQDRWATEWLAPEPGELALKQSGVLFQILDDAALTLAFAGGSQSHSTYTIAAAVRSGMVPVVHRIDNSGGMTVVRGTNTIVINGYRTGTGAGNLGSSLTGKAYINYVSDKSSQGGGDSNHNTTVRRLIQPYIGDGNSVTSSAITIDIPQTSYYLNPMFVNYETWGGGTAQIGGGYQIHFDAASTDAVNYNDGWPEFFSTIYRSDSEQGMSIFNGGNLTNLFKRFPADNRTGTYNFETARAWKMDVSGIQTYPNLEIYYTVSGSTWVVSGTLSNYAGDGSGITVNVFRSDNAEWLGSATSSAGGGYTTVVYSDTYSVYTTAYEDATHKGMSAVVTPGSTANIDLAPAGGGGGGSFTFVQ